VYPFKVIAQRRTQTFLHPVTISYVFMDYVVSDLESELQLRGSGLQDNELWGLLLAVLSTLLYLSQRGVEPNTVWMSTRHVHLTPSGVFKL
jgi:hypothetical protein